jgi:hypothetical protein
LQANKTKEEATAQSATLTQDLELITKSVEKLGCGASFCSSLPEYAAGFHLSVRTVRKELSSVQLAMEERADFDLKNN